MVQLLSSYLVFVTRVDIDLRTMRTRSHHPITTRLAVKTKEKLVLILKKVKDGFGQQKKTSLLVMPGLEEAISHEE
jgi:hypothetical protein